MSVPYASVLPISKNNERKVKVTETLTLALCISCQTAESIIEVPTSMVFLPTCRDCGEDGLYTIDEFANLVPEISGWLAEELAALDADHYWV